MQTEIATDHLVDIVVALEGAGELLGLFCYLVYEVVMLRGEECALEVTCLPVGIELLFALTYAALDGASSLVADEDRGTVGLEGCGAPGIAGDLLREVVDDRLDMLAGA